MHIYLVLMHVNSLSITGFHSFYYPNVEVRVYDKQPRDNDLSSRLSAET